MRVFIAGASGVLGKRLTRQFVARGHSVVGLVRNANKENIVREMGGDPRQADLFDAESLARAADGCDTVIHAATAIPAKRKTTPADWAMNDRIRRQGTRCLTEAAAKIGARTYLQESIVWVARPPDGSPFDEDSPTTGNPTTQSAVDSEAIVRESCATEGFATAILRCGAFYDSDSAHIRMLADGLKKRSMPIIGAGDAVWAMIHTDDAASAFISIAEHPRNGTWHVVDNELVTVGTLLETFASRLGAPPPRHLPAWLARLFAGEQPVEYFTQSTRTTSARLRHDFGWNPRYPTYREGLDQIIATWNAPSARNSTAKP